MLWQRRPSSSSPRFVLWQWIKQYHHHSRRCFATSSIDTATAQDDTTTVPSIIELRAPVNASFRRQRVALAQHWLREFNTLAFGGQLLSSSTLDDRITLQWSHRLRTTAGRALLRTTRSKEATTQRSVIIELSTKVVDDLHRLQTTLLHELCHAAAWLVQGSARPPHGPCFQQWAQKAMAAVPSIRITTRHNFNIHYPYVYSCGNTVCAGTLVKRRRRINVQRYVCGQCQGPLQLVPSHISSSSISSSSSSEEVKEEATRQRRRRRPLSEYHRFIQTNAPLVARLLQGTIKAATKQTLGKRKSKPPPRKVSPQRVLKETAKLWQKQKKKLSSGLV